MRPPALIAAALFASCGPDGVESIAWPWGPRAPEAHQVEVTFHGAEALLRVTWMLQNEDLEFTDLSVRDELPAGGVIAGVRVSSDDRWAEARLMNADEADAMLEGSPGDPGSHPAVRVEVHHSYATIAVEAMAPEQRVRVQYDVRAPLNYLDGAWHFEYRGPSAVSTHGLRVLEVERWSEDDDDSDETNGYVLERPPFDPVQLRWASFPLPTGRTAMRFELEAAPELTPLPDHVSWVFAVDASRSMGEERIAEQLALIPHLLARTPAADVEVVVYRRRAERLFGRFVPAGEFRDALARVDSARLAPGNGSHLDVVAAEVSRVLREVSGTARAVLFTDEELRASFSAELAAAPLGEVRSRASTHLVSMEPGASHLLLERALEHKLAAIAHAGGGMMVYLSGEPTEEGETAQLDALVRPASIDGVTIEPREDTRRRRFRAIWDDDQMLPAGQALVETWVVDDPSPPSVSATGWIWGTRIELSPRADDALAVRLPALMVGEARNLDLEDSELAHAASVARVASEATAFAVPRGISAPVISGPVVQVGGFGFKIGGVISCRAGPSPRASCTPPPHRASRHPLTPLTSVSR